MDRIRHLSDDDLILFLDRDLAAGSAANAGEHLRGCADCQQRLNQLEAGAKAYSQYHQQVLKPSLELPPVPWSKVKEGFAGRDKVNRTWSMAPGLWAAAMFCVLAGAFLYSHYGRVPDARELLTKASAVPEPARERVLMTVAGRKWTRPAVLRGDGNEEAALAQSAGRQSYQHVRALFMEAHYDWQNPLSARSFAAWRNQLPEKQDQVTLINAADGSPRFYRVRTRTSAGLLRTAALTLRADGYRATDATFEFQQEEPIEVSEELPNAAPDVLSALPQKTQLNPKKPVETVAGPEDELRVFAALNAIGADTGDPIEVKLEAGGHHVLVTGLGMTVSRQKEIEAALANLPNSLVRFRAAQPPAPNESGQPNTYSDTVDSSFRKTLETRAGGARQLQAIADRALDASNDLLAEAHALSVLATEFPPNVEAELRLAAQSTLQTLRQRHHDALESSLRQLNDGLRPLIDSASSQQTDSPSASGELWQKTAAGLAESARNLDQRLSRLLAGGYTEQAGKEASHQLRDDLARVQALIHTQIPRGR